MSSILDQCLGPQRAAVPDPDAAASADDREPGFDRSRGLHRRRQRLLLVDRHPAQRRQRRRHRGQPGAGAEPVGAVDRLLGDQLDHHHDQLDRIGADRRRPTRARASATSRRRSTSLGQQLSGRGQRRLVQRPQRPRRFADRGARLRLRLQRLHDRRHDQHDRVHRQRADRRRPTRRRTASSKAAPARRAARAPTC